MSLIWKNDWDTGIDAIDVQHRCIMNYINKLSHIVPDPKPRPPAPPPCQAVRLPRLRAMLHFLGRYPRLNLAMLWKSLFVISRNILTTKSSSMLKTPISWRLPTKKHTIYF